MTTITSLCHLSGALPITGAIYGSVDRVPVTLAFPICTGNESSLLDCHPLNSSPVQLGQTTLYQDQMNSLENYVGVRCEGMWGFCIGICATIPLTNPAP